MKIAVLGSKGLIGSDLVYYLSAVGNAVGINRDNYEDMRDQKYDIFINANGNSKKFIAERLPLFDFEASVESVYKTIYDFNFDKYIFVSSVDVLYPDSTTYGFHKKMAEMIIQRHIDNYILIRPVSVVGRNLKKGVVFDILNANTLNIAPTSKLGFISTKGIADFIMKVLELDISGAFVTGSVDTITPLDIANILNKKLDIDIKDGAPVQKYDYTELLPEFFKFKTAEEYILEGIANEGME